MIVIPRQSSANKPQDTTIYQNELYRICAKGASNASQVLSQLMRTSVRLMVIDIQAKTTISTYKERIKSFLEKCISAYRKDTTIIHSNVVRYPSKDIVGVFIMFVEKNDATKISNSMIQQGVIQHFLGYKKAAIIEMGNIIANSYTRVLSENVDENYVADGSKVIDYEGFGVLIDSMLKGGNLDTEYVFFKNILIVDEHSIKIPALVGFSEKFITQKQP